MAWRKEKGRQDIVEIGKDIDARTCETEMGGKKGSDGVCRVVKSGMDEHGDIHIKVVGDKNSGQS